MHSYLSDLVLGLLSMLKGRHIDTTMDEEGATYYRPSYAQVLPAFLRLEDDLLRRQQQPSLAGHILRNGYNGPLSLCHCRLP